MLREPGIARPAPDDPRPLLTAPRSSLAAAVVDRAGRQHLPGAEGAGARTGAAVAADEREVALLEAAELQPGGARDAPLPDGFYVVTAGLLNSSADADERQRNGARRDRQPFYGSTARALAAWPVCRRGTGHQRALRRPSAQLGWHARGHFLAYAVIARTDGARSIPTTRTPRPGLYLIEGGRDSSCTGAPRLSWTAPLGGFL